MCARSASELGVRYVLEGSVAKGRQPHPHHRSADRRESGTHIWAERYDRAIEDIFAVQDEITLTSPPRCR